VPIQDASADVRASFKNTEKYDVDDAPAYFEEVVIDLSVVSPAAPANVRKLVIHAERGCHAAQSLGHPIPVRLNATLNQQPLP
jgi:organic hydroperoxide reductase OsmC/OhrA